MSSTTAPRTTFAIWRSLVVYAVLAVVSMVIIGRLFTMQILEYNKWNVQADENRTREINVQTQRGIIYDRNGYILARNIASYNIVITPADLPDDEADIQEIYRQLSKLTGVPTGFPLTDASIEDAKGYSTCVPGPGIAQLVALGDSIAPYSPVRIDCNVSEDLARIVREKETQWPGVSVEIQPVRDYPTGYLTANVIGFLGPIAASQQKYYEDLGFVTNRDKIGYAGVEAYFQDVLQGKNGRRVIEVDVAGQELRNLVPPVDPVPGENLVLTIDTRLQKVVQSALESEINSWNAYFGRISISSGVVIVMNPKTGEILAMANYPTYENNRLARLIPYYYYRQLEQDPRKPLLNSAIQTEYPPGSVFKLNTATGSLNEGVIKLGQIVETPGILSLTESYSPNDPGFERQFVDWIYKNGQNPGGFGALDFFHCIAYSSNVCFYKLGGGYKDEIPEGLGILRLAEYARALGYGQLSGIELPGEVDGMIPSPQWKRIYRGENWSTGDTYLASVGQGYVLATPIQVLMSAATIANDGKQMKPTIIREITDSTGKVQQKWINPDTSVTDTPTDPQSRQISPFTPTMRWDVTKDPLITEYSCEGGYCVESDTGQKKVIQDWVIQSVQQGMRLAITDPKGTLHNIFAGQTQQFSKPFPIAVAGKTGTAEYCDNVAQSLNRCTFGNWPSHAWTVAFAPYDDPEIAVVAFAYNGNEGSTVAGPIVRLVMEAYFCFKTLDANPGSLAGCE